jgi:lipopolysaccharide export system permease protein
MPVKLVDRYVGKAALMGMLAIWAGMTVLFMLFSLLGELRATEGNYTSGDAFWFVALTTPRMAYQIFPVSALLGALVGVGGLAASNELVAFRTSGASRLRLAGAALAGAMLMTLPVVLMGEWIAPATEQQARAFRLSEQVGQAIIGGPRGMWMRDGEDIVNIQRPLLSADRGQQSVEFKNVVIYNFSEDVDLQAITRAANASHDGEIWKLEGVRTVEFDENGASRSRAREQVWPSEVKPELLDSAVTRPKLLSLRSLWDYLGYLAENGLDDRVYQAAFWEKLLYPFTVVALVLAGMPFVFASTRSQNLGVRMFTGMTLGGVYMIVSRAVQKFGGVYDIHALATNLLPPLILAVAAILILRRSV